MGDCEVSQRMVPYLYLIEEEIEVRKIHGHKQSYHEWGWV